MDDKRVSRSRKTRTDSWIADVIIVGRLHGCEMTPDFDQSNGTMSVRLF